MPAVVAFDDLTAQGIMTGMADRGVSVPEQISIVGCDDVLGAATYPSLTTVSNRSDEAGRAGMSLLLDMLNSRAVGDARLVLGTHLVVRNTTASPPEKGPTPAACHPGDIVLPDGAAAWPLVAHPSKRRAGRCDRP